MTRTRAGCSPVRGVVRLGARRAARSPVRGVAWLAALFAVVVGLAGCVANAQVSERIPGRTLRIYSSVPLQGASQVDAVSVLRGARLALDEVHGTIGKYHIALETLDDSTVQRGRWDPGQTTVNARRALTDRTTIGYLGDLDSGASAISIPLLNRAGIAQVSPTATAVGLTSDAAGASPGEPEKYYPTGLRTFARVLPDDAVQAAVQVKLQLGAGCSKTYVVDDAEVDGQDAATSFEVAARFAHLQVVGTQTFQPGATDYTPLAVGVAQSGAGCVLISALTASNAALVTEQIAAALPRAKIFGTAGVSDRAFTDPDLGGVPYALDSRVLLTVAALGPSAYPASGRAFYTAYARRYGPPPPYAIFGYEAMSLMLNAIDRATDHGRAVVKRSKVVAAIFSTRDRHSVLGTYSIDRDGDTTLRRYGVYRMIAGRLTFWKAIDA